MYRFKISCHSIGDIMSGEVGLTDVQQSRLNELLARQLPGAKPLTPNMEEELKKLIDKRDNPELPAGAKTYCKKWLKKKLFNRNENWKALVIDKGLAVEDDLIALIADVKGLDGLRKNDRHYENEFMKGTPDMVHQKVRDAKASWDLFTFPMFDDKIPDQKYWWQLQGYMVLTGIKEASLDYGLIDTPMPIIQQDLKRLYYQSGGTAEEWTPERWNEKIPNYQFTDIPKDLRVRSFEFEYDTTIADKICARVQLCQKYIDSLMDNNGM
jgi:hypothetical protein